MNWNKIKFEIAKLQTKIDKRKGLSKIKIINNNIELI